MELDIQDKTILLCARRGSGKSELIKYMIKEFGHLFECVIVISTTDFSGFYKQIIPEKNISNVYQDKIVESLLNKLEKTNKGKNQKDENFKRVLLVLDDVISDTRLASSKSLEKVYTKGRHYGITLILASQYIKKIPPVMRENVDLVFIGKHTENSRGIFTEEFNDYLTNKEFENLLKKNAGVDYNFVIINATARNQSESIGIFRVDL